MIEKELRVKLCRIFDIGWEIGHYTAKNSTIALETLRKGKITLFEERDQLIKEIEQIAGN